MDTTKVAVAVGTDFKGTSLSNTLKTLELQATHTHTLARSRMLPAEKSLEFQKSSWD